MGIRKIFETSVKLEAFTVGHYSDYMHGVTKKNFAVVGTRLRDSARARVMPGVGPGPHPHRTKHIDTGIGAQNIVYRMTKLHQGWQVEVGPKPKAYYLTYLELGWHAASGRFYKYPWLRPTMKAEWPSISNYLLQDLFQAHINKYFRNPSNRARSVKLIKGR